MDSAQVCRLPTLQLEGDTRVCLYLTGRNLLKDELADCMNLDRETCDALGVVAVILHLPIEITNHNARLLGS